MFIVTNLFVKKLTSAINNTAVCVCVVSMRLLSWQKHPTLEFIIAILNLAWIYCSSKLQKSQWLSV